MNKEALHGFTARITQASRSELVVILYEMILTEIEDARAAYGAEDFVLFHRELKKAQKYVNELMATLDYRYQISYDLFSLYLYSSREIITAMMKKDLTPLNQVEEIINKLLIGFEEVSRQDKGGPLMRNTQQLYAGLTYGKGSLTETSLDPGNGNRGFMA